MKIQKRQFRNSCVTITWFYFWSYFHPCLQQKSSKRPTSWVCCVKYLLVFFFCLRPSHSWRLWLWQPTKPNNLRTIWWVKYLSARNMLVISKTNDTDAQINSRPHTLYDQISIFCFFRRDLSSFHKAINCIFYILNEKSDTIVKKRETYEVVSVQIT